MCGVSGRQIVTEAATAAKSAAKISFDPTQKNKLKANVTEVQRIGGFLSGSQATKERQEEADKKRTEQIASLNAPRVPATPVAGPSIDDTKRRRTLLTQDSPFNPPSTILT